MRTEIIKHEASILNLIHNHDDKFIDFFDHKNHKIKTSYQQQIHSAEYSDVFANQELYGKTEPIIFWQKFNDSFIPTDYFQGVNCVDSDKESRRDINYWR